MADGRDWLQWTDGTLHNHIVYALSLSVSVTVNQYRVSIVGRFHSIAISDLLPRDAWLHGATWLNWTDILEN
jgi:hypothetical protein